MERQLDGGRFEKTAVAMKPKPLPLGSGCYHDVNILMVGQILLINGWLLADYQMALKLAEQQGDENLKTTIEAVLQRSKN